MKPLNTLNTQTTDPTVFRKRVGIAVIFVFICFSLLFFRLTYLQLIKQHDYTAAPESNRTVSIPIAATRGLVRDRNGEMLAQNYWAYSLDIDLNKLGSRKLNDVLAEL